MQARASKVVRMLVSGALSPIATVGVKRTRQWLRGHRVSERAEAKDDFPLHVPSRELLQFRLL